MKPSTVTGAIDAGRATIVELARDGRGWILLSIAFGWFLGLGIRLAAPVLVPYIRADFGIGLSTAGLLLSLLWITYALLQLPGGILGDRIGERNVLVASSILAIVALLASAVAWSVLALFCAFALLGSATGAYATTRFTSLADIYPERSATAIGLSSSAGNVGTVVVPAMAGLLAAVASWRVGFAMAVPFFVVAVAGLWIVVPARTSGSESAVDELSLESMRRIIGGLASRHVLLMTVSMFLMSFVYQGFTSFYPTYLVSMKGLSESTAALLYSTFFGVAILVQAGGGAIADSIGNRPSIVGFTAVAAAALVLLVPTTGFWPLVLISVVLSTQLGFWPIVQAEVIGRLPTEMQGTGFGFLRTAYLLLAASSPTLVGFLGERGRFDEAFLLLAACSLGCTVIALFFWKE